MQKVNREKTPSRKAGGGRGVTEQVYLYVQSMYPYPFMPKILANELGLNYEAVKKACNNLFKQSRIARPTGIRRGWYVGVPTVENISGLEEPEITVHNLKIEVRVSEKILKNLGNVAGVSPLPLYTQRELIETGGTEKRANDSGRGHGFYQVVKYWTMNQYPHKITFQFFTENVLIHIHATKSPLNTEAMMPLHSWLCGVLEGLGVNMSVTDMAPVYAELTKDYEKITITPGMLSIQDLTDGSILRWYRKARNCHRMELGTTFEGERALLEIFLNFGKPQGSRHDDRGLGGMFR